MEDWPKPIPVAIQRLMDEVRHDAPTAYDRAHNRHNRSGETSVPVKRPREDPPPPPPEPPGETEAGG